MLHRCGGEGDDLQSLDNSEDESSDDTLDQATEAVEEISFHKKSQQSEAERENVKTEILKIVLWTPRTCKLLEVEEGSAPICNVSVMETNAQCDSAKLRIFWILVTGHCVKVVNPGSSAWSIHHW